VNAHSILWTSPAPLWGRFGAADFSAADQERPAILRFATDEFMEQLLAMLAADPRRLGDVIARPETWRSPATDPPDLIDRVPLPRFARTLARLRKSEAASTALLPTTHQLATAENNVARTLTLKLYHPAHQRHYLVAANLVCGLTGFPDRAIATGGREQVGFVLRRLLPPRGATTASVREEFAFVKDASGARWQRVAAGAASSDADPRLVDGEELLPLFPLNFRDDREHPRRILAGVVPVGRREEYMSTRAQHDAPAGGASTSGGAGASPSSGDPTVITARKEQLKLDVTEPWKNVIRTAHATAARLKEKPAPDQATQDKAVKSVNHQLQAQSWLLLLDFADYLSLHLKEVWEAVLDPSKKGALAPAARMLFDWLDGPGTAPKSEWLVAMDTGGRPFATSLRDALKQVRASDAVRAGLEGAVRSYPNDPGAGLAWPPFLYLLAGVSSNVTASGIHESLNTVTPVVMPDKDDLEAPVPATPPAQKAIDASIALLDKLVPLVIKAIDTTKAPAPAPPVPFAARLRDALVTTQGDEGWFVLRCAYVRCDCGPLQPTVLSAPSQRFQLASFFDSDAPARAIRIALPVDTTPAGMRKFNKNTAFVISDVLCGQMQRAKGLGFGDLVLSVLPWPFHKDLDIGGDGIGPCESGPGVSIGMICSLSIPIITICALILLMMIVLVLDLIFKWIPWFIMCFPLPGFKAKN
jgi:hypothetical protein